MNIQAEKLKLVEWLNSINDQSIIEKLKIFKDNFSENVDWWETLSETERESIDRGLKDIKEGNLTQHSEVMKKYGE